MQLIWINEMVVLKKALIPLAVRILPQLEVWVRFCISNNCPCPGVSVCAPTP